MRRLLLALLCLAAATARAEVTAVSPSGFTSSFRAEVRATPQQAFAALVQVPRWWNMAHSYSRRAENLRLGLRAGECFCEEWDGHSIEHARVLHVQRDATLRLQGALGPLQELGANGILTFTTGAVDGRTVIRMVYRVSGSPEMGLDRLAAVVDRVMGDQFGRWQAHVDSGVP